MDNTPHDKRFESWITSFLMRTNIDRSHMAIARDFRKSSASMVKSLRSLRNQADTDYADFLEEKLENMSKYEPNG